MLRVRKNSTCTAAPAKSLNHRISLSFENNNFSLLNNNNVSMINSLNVSRSISSKTSYSISCSPIHSCSTLRPNILPQQDLQQPIQQQFRNYTVKIPHEEYPESIFQNRPEKIPRKSGEDSTVDEEEVDMPRMLDKELRSEDKSKKHHRYSNKQFATLQKWFDSHKEHPFPSLEERHQLAEQTGLPPKRVKNFLQKRTEQLKTKHLNSSRGHMSNYIQNYLHSWAQEKGSYYPNHGEMEQLAFDTHLGFKQIKKWFEKRQRAATKRTTKGTETMYRK